MAKKRRGAPSKTCPQCNAKVHARVATCPKCSHVFVAKKGVVKKKLLGKRKTVRRKKAKRRRTVAAAGAATFSLTDIQAAKMLVSRIGGAARAKNLLDALG